MKIKNLLLIITAALILNACTFNLGKKGNGNVITEERSISENFTEITSSVGIDVYLTQGTEIKITVEADENLQKYIKTDIKDGKLHITTSEKIGWSTTKKVYVTFINLNKIEATSGSSVVANSIIKNEILSLYSNSGAEIELEVFSKELIAQTSSGAEIKVRGKASSFSATASSGSEIDARELQTIHSVAEASSGADISLNVKDKLQANASSGASIEYYGNPISVEANNSSSGDVKKK